MQYQHIFKRYELKYLLTVRRKEELLQIMKPYMTLDQYGRTTIRNLYLDTDDYRLIRRSIEKPVYKEKLRLRSYRRATDESAVFLELKKKYKSVVYKRRIALPEQEAEAWLEGGDLPNDSQIAREIDYFKSFYGPLSPKVFLSYEREAFYCNQGGDLRITFDDHILCRRQDLSLASDVWGTPILDPQYVLMEVKTAGAMPLWLTRALTVGRIYKTSFSKYGTAYRNLIFKDVFDHV